MAIRRIGPDLVFARLWKESGIADVLRSILKERHYEFDVERAIYLTVLHRLFASGSDRAAERWREDYLIPGTEGLELHHLYRAMAFLGEAIEELEEALELAPRAAEAPETYFTLGSCWTTLGKPEPAEKDPSVAWTSPVPPTAGVEEAQPAGTVQGRDLARGRHPFRPHPPNPRPSRQPRPPNHW